MVEVAVEVVAVAIEEGAVEVVVVVEMAVGVAPNVDCNPHNRSLAKYSGSQAHARAVVVSVVYGAPQSRSVSGQIRVRQFVFRTVQNVVGRNRDRYFRSSTE